MNNILVEKISEEKKKEMNIPNECQDTDAWSVWECNEKDFDWHYDSKEIAYVYEGKVIVKTENQEVEINAGDLVTFPAGLSCQWKVLEKIRKVYMFE